jgi:hypothetical protein
LSTKGCNRNSTNSGTRRNSAIKDGRVLGVFIPALANDREHRQYERARAQYSADEVAELQQLSKERAGRTTEQVKQRLRELAAGSSSFTRTER